MTREERIQSLAARAGYRCVDDLKKEIRESRKAFAALELKQFDAKISPDSEAHAISVAEAKTAKAESDNSAALSRSGVGERFTAAKAAHPYAAKNRGERADTAPQKTGCAASDAGHGARGDPATAVFAWCAWWRAPLTLCYPSMQQPARKFYRK